MGQYYLIKDIKRGNEWSNSFGNFQSYSLSLEGMGEPVSLNKAVPVKDEPEVGQKLYGTVELLQSQKGVTYYKFKTEKVPDGEYTAPQPQNQPQGSYEGHSDKEDSIARAYVPNREDGMRWGNSLNVAVVALQHDIEADQLLEYATKLYNHRTGASDENM